MSATLPESTRRAYVAGAFDMLSAVQGVDTDWTTRQFACLDVKGEMLSVVTLWAEHIWRSTPSPYNAASVLLDGACD